VSGPWASPIYHAFIYLPNVRTYSYPGHCRSVHNYIHSGGGRDTERKGVR